MGVYNNNYILKCLEEVTSVPDAPGCKTPEDLVVVAVPPSFLLRTDD